MDNRKGAHKLSRLFYYDTHKLWDKWLALFEFCYSSTKHHTISMSPFEAMYECKVWMPSLIADMPVKNQQARNDLESMDAPLYLAKRNMQDAQSEQKKYADTRRRYLSFEEGDYVHLCLHNNRYASLKGNTSYHPWMRKGTSFMFQIASWVSEIVNSEKGLHKVSYQVEGTI